MLSVCEMMNGLGSTLVGAAAEQGHNIWMWAELLHDFHLAQQFLLLLGLSAVFDGFNGHQTGALDAANVLGFGFPHLAEVAFADQRLQSETRPGKFPRRDPADPITCAASGRNQILFVAGLQKFQFQTIQNVFKMMP